MLTLTFNKIYKSIGILHKLKEDLPSKYLLQLYHSMVQPYLNYCTLTWMNTSHSNKIRLLKLQKKAVRAILHRPGKDHSLPLFSKLSILPIHDLMTFRAGLHTFKNKHNLIKYNYNSHNHNTRKMLDCHPIFQRTTVSKMSLIGQIPVIWNSIPASIKCCKSAVFQKTLFCPLYFY